MATLASQPIQLESLDVEDDPSIIRRAHTVKVVHAAEKFLGRFGHTCDTSHRASLSAAIHPDTIKKNLDAVDLNATLNLQNATQVFRTSYGYRSSWLLLPEDGLRGLLKESLLIYETPLHSAVDAAHSSVMAAVKAAAGGNKKKINNDIQLQERLGERMTAAIDGWRDQTKNQLSGLLLSEAMFPSRERFVGLKLRLQQLLDEEAAKTEAELRRKLAITLGFITPDGSLPSLAIATAPVSGPAAADNHNKNSNNSQHSEVERYPIKNDHEEISFSEFWMGWLEKLNRHGMWQKRWFAVSVKQQRTFYFQQPEEQPARAALSLVGAQIVDIPDECAFQIIFAPSLGSVSSEGAPVSGVFSPLKTKTAVEVLTVRAASTQGKQQWMKEFSKAVQGLPKADAQQLNILNDPIGRKLTPIPLNTHLSTLTSSSDDDSTAIDQGPVERKISTVVYPDSTSDSNTKVESKRTVFTGSSSAASESVESYYSDEDDKSTDTAENEEDDPFAAEAKEQKRKEAEDCLFEEIMQQSQRQPTESEIEVLKCVTEAVEEYVDVARGRLADLSSKLIATSMLPGPERLEQLREVLLNELNSA